MRFVPVTAKQLQETQTAISKGYADSDDLDFWESYFVIKTNRGDITMSTPGHAASIGIYFQPRPGTGGPVICLNEVAELHRVIR